MKNYTKEKLIEEGYEIENVIIRSVDISMADHCCVVLRLAIEGKGWGSTYGGYAIGHGSLGGDSFDSSPKGIELIARVMNIAGVEYFNNMKGRYIRVALKRNEPIKIIGHIIRDEWFDIKSFFSEDN